MNLLRAIFGTRHDGEDAKLYSDIERVILNHEQYIKACTERVNFFKEKYEKVSSFSHSELFFIQKIKMDIAGYEFWVRSKVTLQLGGQRITSKLRYVRAKTWKLRNSLFSTPQEKIFYFKGNRDKFGDVACVIRLLLPDTPEENVEE